jgi:hypothetical protein
VVGPLETVDAASAEEGWQPTTVVDRRGTVTVVWDRVSGGRFAAQRSPSGTWSVPERIGCPGFAACGSAHLAVNDAGLVTAVWDTSGGGRSKVKVVTKSPNGGWSAPLTLTRGRAGRAGYEPRLDASPRGAAVISWNRIAQDGVVVLRKRAGLSWSNAKVRVFTDMAGADDVAIGRDGAVLVIGDDDSDSMTPHVVLHAFRPRHGWLPARILGTEGGDLLTTYVAIGRHGRAAASWSVGSADDTRSAVLVRRMDAQFRWKKAIRVSRWYGGDNAVFISDLRIGPRGTVTVVWSGRVDKVTTRLPSGTWVARQPVPSFGAMVWGSFSADRGGDAVVAWNVPVVENEELVGEEVHVSLRTYPSTTWQRSGVLGTSGCGTGERGDPGCRPFAAAALPDRSALAVWFDQSNALVARVVR